MAERRSVPSDASDPLERLCDDATALATATDVAIAAASEHHDLLPLSLEVLTERLADVANHDGPEWLYLDDANGEPITRCGETGCSWVDLTALIARSVYLAFLKAGDPRDALEFLIPVAGQLSFTKLKVPCIPAEEAESAGGESAYWDDLANLLEKFESFSVGEIHVWIGKEHRRAERLRGGGGGGGEELKTLSREASAVRSFLGGRNGVLATIDDIEVGAGLARATAGKACQELIDKGLADRPNGPRKGIALTASGRSRTNLAQT